MSAGDSPQTTLADRVRRTRVALRSARTARTAWMALSFADDTTLRVIEHEFGLAPAAPDELRARIVAVHMSRVQAAQLAWDRSSNTSKVTAELVRRWVVNVLDQFMIGHTDHEPEHHQSYKITKVGIDADDTLLIQVTTFEGRDPRQFRVGLTVEEVVG